MWRRVSSNHIIFTHGFSHVTIFGIVPSSWKVHVAKRQLISKCEKLPKPYKHTWKCMAWFLSRFFFLQLRMRCVRYLIGIGYMCFFDFVTYEFRLCRFLSFLMVKCFLIGLLIDFTILWSSTLFSWGSLSSNYSQSKQDLRFLDFYWDWWSLSITKGHFEHKS